MLAIAEPSRAAPRSAAQTFADAVMRICVPAVRSGAAPTAASIEAAGFSLDQSRVGMAPNPQTGRTAPPYPDSFGAVFFAEADGLRIWGYAGAHACAVRVNGAEGAFETALESLRSDPNWARAIRFADAQAVRNHDVEIETAYQGRRLVASLGAFRAKPSEWGAGGLFSSARIEAVSWEES
jgi:hypothetical protein